eukprot:GHUV01012330.1.p1 GENE.GHUV01012330.1~~GHUV01012330.1.p1  ORF type:complete len:136 (+),score=7.06 GHUV01012330.1:477-884(+)
MVAQLIDNACNRHATATPTFRPHDSAALKAPVHGMLWYTHHCAELHGYPGPPKRHDACDYACGRVMLSLITSNNASTKTNCQLQRTTRRRSPYTTLGHLPPSSPTPSAQRCCVRGIGCLQLGHVDCFSLHSSQHL